MKQYNYAFIMSDIHGCIDEFNTMLDKWNPDTQHLILLGDYIDRGQHSYDVMARIIQLVNTYDNVTVCKGNHDDEFEYAIRSGNIQYIPYETRKSYETRTKTTLFTPHEWEKVAGTHLTLIKHMPHYTEFGNVVCTHAGFDTTLDDWQKTHKKDFLWIRNHMKKPSKTFTGVNVFGHTPTPNIHGDNDRFDVWKSDTGQYIGIDGACAYGGVLNGIVIDRNGHICEEHVVESATYKMMRTYQ